MKADTETKLYLLAQVLVQNLFDPLNWLAGARFPQYSHFNTEQGKKRLYTTDHKHSLKVPCLMNNKPPLTWRSVFCAANQGKISVFGKPSNLSHQDSKTLCFFSPSHGNLHIYYLTLCVCYHTYREGLSSLLNHKALDNMSENLWFDDSLGNRCSVFVPVPYS